MGNRLPFRLTPWLPTAWNCVQVANDILNAAGIYPPSPFQHAVTIYTPRLERGLKKLPAKME
jgi:hypothetical protein